MRVREAIRLFFEAWDKKLPAAGCKAIHTSEIHATGSIGRRSLIPATAPPFHFGRMAVVQTKKARDRDGPGPGIRAYLNELSPGNLRSPGLWFYGEELCPVRHQIASWPGSRT